jgi:hypothetical protein
MTVDIWIPKYNLALEYQGILLSWSLFIHLGEPHFYNYGNAFGRSGMLESYKERDERKKRLCAELGIDLVAIPFW